MKRHLTTIILVLAAVALVVYVWLDKDKMSTTERKGREFSVFPAWRKDDVTRIEIAHEGETIVLERANKDASWRMKSPRDERVDPGAVERLQTTLEFATRVRPVVANDALAFEHPRASGSVTMGAMTFRFVLGGASPRPEGSGYLKVDDGTPFVGSKELTDALLAHSDAYRDRSVVPYLSLELSKFSVTHPAGGFSLQRFDERSFQVAIDGGLLLSSKKQLDQAWGALAEMRAESFPKDADVDRLTANPRLTIRMEPKDASKGAAVLVVGDACPGHADDVVVLRKEPTRGVACAPKGAMDRLLALGPADFVDRHPFGFRHDEIEELRLEGGDAKPIELARRGTGFHLREPQDRDLTTEETAAANGQLQLIEEGLASEVKQNRKAPFAARAKAKVRVQDFVEDIEVGETGIHRLRDDAILTMTPRQRRRFVPRETTFRPLKLLPADPRRVTRVALRCGVEQDLVDTGPGLRLTQPAGYETAGSITTLVDEITRGTVEEWTADRDDGSFGITEACRVVLSYEDGNTPRTLRFGKTTGDGMFGQIDGERAVFVAGPVLTKFMKLVYVSPSAIRVDPSEVTRLEAKSKGKVVPADLRKTAGITGHAVKLGTADVGPVDVELTFTLGDGGGTQRIVCSAAEGKARNCANPSIKAVFEVETSIIDAIIRPTISDAGSADAR